MSTLYRMFGIRRIILDIQNLAFNLIYSNYFKNRVKIFGFPLVIFKNKENISVGRNLVLISNSFFSEPGINHLVIIRTFNENAKIINGDNVGLSGITICASKLIKIGNNYPLGANVQILDTDFHPIGPSNRRFSRYKVKSKEIIT